MIALLGSWIVYGFNKFTGKYQIRSIMSSVDKYTNVLDDKKWQWSRHHCRRRKYWKLRRLKQVMRCTVVLRILQQVSRLLKVLMRFTNVLIILQQVRRLTKVLIHLKIWKRMWSQSVGRIQIIFRVGLKDLQDGLILIMSL